MHRFITIKQHRLTLRSAVIPVISPDQEVAFIAIPVLSVAPNIRYYNCTDIDLHPNMNTLEIGKDEFIRYDLHRIVRISDFKYEALTDSIVFAVGH